MRTEPRLAGRLLGAALLAGALAGLAPPAAACGYCVEDKIASAYDHAMVTQALARRQQVAFFHVDGPLAADEASSRWLAATAAAAAGVGPAGVRVAAQTLTLAVTFDPARTSLVKLQNALDRKLAARRLSLMPLRVIDAPGQLTALGR